MIYWVEKAVSPKHLAAFSAHSSEEVIKLLVVTLNPSLLKEIDSLSRNVVHIAALSVNYPKLIGIGDINGWNILHLMITKNNFYAAKFTIE